MALCACFPQYRLFIEEQKRELQNFLIRSLLINKEEKNMYTITINAKDDEGNKGLCLFYFFEEILYIFDEGLTWINILKGRGNA